MFDDIEAKERERIKEDVKISNWNKGRIYKTMLDLINLDKIDDDRNIYFVIYLTFFYTKIISEESLSMIPENVHIYNFQNREEADKKLEYYQKKIMSDPFNNHYAISVVFRKSELEKILEEINA